MPLDPPRMARAFAARIPPPPPKTMTLATPLCLSLHKNYIIDLKYIEELYGIKLFLYVFNFKN